MSFADILDAKPKEPKLYQILGCDERSTTDQITAEYRSRVRDFHPDKVSEDQEPTEATEKFLELQSTHWAVPKTQPSINAVPSAETIEKESVKNNSRWADGDRYQSSITSAFRNYKL